MAPLCPALSGLQTGCPCAASSRYRRRGDSGGAGPRGDRHTERPRGRGSAERPTPARAVQNAVQGAPPVPAAPRAGNREGAGAHPFPPDAGPGRPTPPRAREGRGQVRPPPTQSALSPARPRAGNARRPRRSRRVRPDGPPARSRVSAWRRRAARDGPGLGSLGRRSGGRPPRLEESRPLGALQLLPLNKQPRFLRGTPPF